MANLSRPYLIDTHCHLHDAQFYSEAQISPIIERATSHNVLQIIVIGTDPEDSLQAGKFAHLHENIFFSYGIHPEEAKNYPAFSRLFTDSSFLDSLKSEKSSGKLVAIGEVGLDYHYGIEHRTKQIELFQQMIDLSIKLQLPLIFHIREAFDDFFAIIDDFPEIKNLNGVIHSFTDNKKNLRKALERDFYIGINGLATYSTLPTPPLERILLETDAPFLTPAPFRDTINESSHVHTIATWLSTKLGVSESEIAEITTRNARRLFNLPHPVLRQARGL